MIVLSLFDGMSCGQIALNRVGIHATKYYASEIKKSGITTTQLHYPDTVQLGDVTQISYRDGVLYTKNGEFFVGHIDLLIGGSPCQDFSILKVGGLGLKGDKSILFYEYLRLLREINPTYFLLENVKMKKSSICELNTFLMVDGMEINSKLVSFQNRPRLYWTNIPNVIPPEDKHVNFQHFKDSDYAYCSKFKVNKTLSREKMWNCGNGQNSPVGGCSNVTNSEKVYCLTRKQDRSPNSGLIEFDGFCRYLTQRELELAQTVPEGYTKHLSYNQACDLLGDGWTIDVISHILSFIPKE